MSSDNGECILEPVRGPFRTGDRVYVPECQAWGTVELVEAHDSPFEPYLVRFDEPYPGGIRARSYAADELRDESSPEASSAAAMDLRGQIERLGWELVDARHLIKSLKADRDDLQELYEATCKKYVDADNRAYRLEYQPAPETPKRPWWRFR